jgi:hypothetical protein
MKSHHGLHSAPDFLCGISACIALSADWLSRVWFKAGKAASIGGAGVIDDLRSAVADALDLTASLLISITFL